MVEHYWNHNTAYHPWLRDIAVRQRGDVLDVGCGDGLLLQRLAPVSRRVVGIDSDAAAVDRARRRLQGTGNAAVDHVDFAGFDAPDGSFDLVTFVASIHHQPLAAALSKARRLLKPGGELAVVGLATNASLRDWGWALLCMPAVVVGSKIHRETPDIGVPIAEPRESLAGIRHLADDVIPGAVIRRGLYYRYLLSWVSP